METSLAWLLHDDYLALLRASGCIGIELGLESLTTTYDKNGLKGRAAPIDAVVERIARIKRHIPLLQVNILLGLDNDTPETFRTVAELYRRANIDELVPFVVTPFPGTPFFDRMRGEGRLFETDWRHFNCANLVLRPRQLSVPAFYDLYMDLLRQLHAPGLVARKVLTHLWQYRDAKIALHPAGAAPDPGLEHLPPSLARVARRQAARAGARRARPRWGRMRPAEPAPALVEGDEALVAS